jgi:hypothetical protein
MLRPPLVRVEPSEGCGNDVGSPLDCVEATETWGEGGLVCFRLERAKQRSRPNVNRIAKMEIRKTIKPKFVVVPTKGRRTDFRVGLEELMNVFPCS